MKTFAKLLIASCSIFTCTTEAIAQVVKEYPRSAYKAEMLVKFPASTVACVTKDALGDFAIHSFKGEKTKAEAVFSEYCTMLSPSKKFKVLSVDFPEDGVMGLLELVGDKNKSAAGAWAFTAGAEPTK